LQSAVDEVWAGIKWVERYNGRGGRRLIPVIPTENSFKNHYLNGGLEIFQTCSRCGKVNSPKGANLYLQMEGLSPTPKLFNGLMRGWSGFTLTGEEAGEGSDEPERSPRPMNPKSYASLPKTT
jgi:hypothetical protein